MTNEWKPEKNISSPWDADVWENNAGEPVINHKEKLKDYYKIANELNEEQSIKPSGDNLPYPYTSLYIHNPEVICECDLFGQKQLVISFNRSNNFPVPNRWIRFWTRVFFNSKWDFKK